MLRNALFMLALAVLLSPFSAYAASLTGEASGGIKLSQGLDMDLEAGIDIGDDATSSPADSSAGDDSNIDVRANAGFMTSVDVADDNDLERYETSLQGSDSYFAEADLASDSMVTISYYHDGRLFGFIPTKVKSQTSVSMTEDGQTAVQTRLPWWSVFVTGTGDIAADVDSRLAASGSVASDMKLAGSAAAKARILEAVAQAHAQARVSAAAN